MPSRAPVCAWIAASALIVPAFAAAQDLRARDVVELIVRESPRAAAIRADAAVVEREQHARLALPNPSVSFSQEGAGFTQFLQIEQALPITGVRQALGRAGVAAVAAAEAERDSRLWQLRADAARAVATMQAAQQRADAAAAQVDAIDRLIGLLRIREREGEGSRFDRLRAEQELADVKRDAVNAAADLAAARGAVGALLPPLRTVVRIADPLSEPVAAPDVTALLARAHDGRAELRALSRVAERMRLEADAASRARLPQPVVSGGMKRADSGTTRETGGVFGVSVNVPLFDTGRREAARWTAEGQRAEAERAAIEQAIRAEVTSAAEVYQLRRDAQIAQTAQTAAPPPSSNKPDDLVAIAEVAYREGEATLLTLLDAVRTSARTRAREIEMRLDAHLAALALERAVGGVLWP